MSQRKAIGGKRPASADSSCGRTRSIRRASNVPDLTHHQLVVISVWLPKGGVGKSTTVFSLGYVLAKRGFRVLLVDGDSQCDLSRLCLKSRVEAEGGDYLGYVQRGNVNRTWKSMIDPVVDAGGVMGEAQPEDIVEVGDGWVKLLAGDPRMDEWEEKLNTGLYAMNTGIPEVLGRPGAPYHAIQRLATQINANIVLIDLPPSSGIFTATTIMSSDYFLTPVKCDFFSLEAIRRLFNKFSRPWVEVFHNAWWAAMGFAQLGFELHRRTAGNVYRFPDKQTRYLGYIINDYYVTRYVPPNIMTIENRDGGVTLEYAPRNLEHWMNAIHTAVVAGAQNMENIVRPGLPPARFSFTMDEYTELHIKQYILCKVCHFYQLQQVSHYYNVPVCFLRNRHMKVDHNGIMRPVPREDRASMKTRSLRHRRNYGQLAWHILALIASHRGLPLPQDMVNFGMQPNQPPNIQGPLPGQQQNEEDNENISLPFTGSDSEDDGGLW